MSKKLYKFSVRTVFEGYALSVHDDPDDVAHQLLDNDEFRIDLIRFGVSSDDFKIDLVQPDDKRLPGWRGGVPYGDNPGCLELESVWPCKSAEVSSEHALDGHTIEIGGAKYKLTAVQD